MIELTFNGILWFLMIHIVFILVSKFIFKQIDVLFYFLVIAFFLVFYFGLSFSDVSDMSAALVTNLK